jgi:glycosyltransferase involved in cell wall biosynthesis
VHVWAPQSDGETRGEPGVYVHRLPGKYGLRALWRLGGELRQQPPGRLILQYTPHAFAFKAMNLPLCSWLLWRRIWHGDDVRVMFHEVAFPFVRRPLKHNLIAVVNRVMAFLLLAACQRVYVSTPAWNGILNRLGGRRTPITWIPVPANVAATEQCEAAQSIRCQLKAGPRDRLIGHFGTYQALVAEQLRLVLRQLLAEPDVRVLLLGRGAEQFRKELVASEPIWEQRVKAVGELSAAGIAAHLQACDLMLQPYPDGVSTRRTTAMACLANGVPTISNLGAASESIWVDDGITPVASTPEPGAIAELALALLADLEKRAVAGRRGRQYYEAHFSLRRIVELYLNESSPS